MRLAQAELLEWPVVSSVLGLPRVFALKVLCPRNSLSPRRIGAVCHPSCHPGVYSAHCVKMFCSSVNSTESKCMVTTWVK